MEEHESLKKRLIERARVGRVIYYSELAPQFHLNFDLERDRAEIGQILDAVSRSENASGRPLLSAVVVHKGDDEMPGEGFFKLARELGLFKSGDKKIYWAMEIKRLQEHWSASDDQSDSGA